MKNFAEATESIPNRCGNSMDPKTRPNHRLYIETLRQMSPSAKLLKAFELSEFSKRLFLDGLRTRFPALPETEFHRLVLERLKQCHNRNY